MQLREKQKETVSLYYYKLSMKICKKKKKKKCKQSQEEGVAYLPWTLQDRVGSQWGSGEAAQKKRDISES